MKNKDKKNFEILLTDWNIVEEVGLPPDGSWCVVVTESLGNSYDWGLGGFNKESNSFYCNLGMGGMITGAESVVAWKAYCDIFENGDKIISSKGCLNDVRLII